MNYIAIVIAQHINKRQQRKNVKNKYRLDALQQQQNHIHQQQVHQHDQEQQAQQHQQQNGPCHHELQQHQELQQQQQQLQQQEEGHDREVDNQLDNNQEEKNCTMPIVEGNELKKTSTKRTFSIPKLFSIRSRSSNMKHGVTMISKKKSSNSSCDNAIMMEDNMEPFIYKLAKSWAWSAVIHRCQTHPDEVKFARDQKTGDNVLHWCTFGNSSVDVVNAVLNVHYDAIKEMNYIKNNLPIHVACSYRSSNDVIKVLVDSYPESVGISNNNGSYPIHILCDYDGPLSVFYTILSNPYVVPTVCMIDNVHYQYPIEILYSRHNTTHFYDFHIRLKNLKLLRHQQIIIKKRKQHKKLQEFVVSSECTKSNDGDDDDDDLHYQQEKISMINNYENFDFWIKICWLLLIEYHQKSLQQQPTSCCIMNNNNGVSFKESQVVLASLYSICCPDYIKDMTILIYPEQLISQTDDYGNVPLHIMAINYYYNNKKENSNMILMMLWMINICPEAASIRNNIGQLPLTCLNNSINCSLKLYSSYKKEDDAYSEDICWSHLIACLIHANPAAIKDIRGNQETDSDDDDDDLRIQQYHVQIWSNLLNDNNNNCSNQLKLYEMEGEDEDQRKQSTCHTIYQNLIQNPSWFCGNYEEM